MRLDTANIARVQAACDAIAEIMDTAAFRSRFSNVRLLRSVGEIEGARQHLPSALLPFMVEPQPESVDVYAFDSNDEIAPKVVVWNDHAVVWDWSSFELFMKWIRDDPRDCV